MENNWLLSPARHLTEDEKSLVWQKPVSHIESAAEQRIREAVKRNWNRGEMKISTILLEGDAGSGKTQLAKALSADFGLPYTKVTCFADMDKSDVLGSILPVLSEDDGQKNSIQYQYYPSEIVRAYENGWLLEIQEPTVIRDAAVLMALNSALEPDDSINLPTRIVRRHPDFIAVITTDRSYNGYRPLNEALYFAKKNPPDENPSLAVGLRIDQSASMNAFGRLAAAKEAAIAVCEFCEACGIPALIYGDTADRSPREEMSVYAYLDWEKSALNDKCSIMSIQGISNNRDGMALRLLSEKLVKAPQATKLLISLSDGQPKAMPDYTGAATAEDMRQTIQEYSRKGVIFLAAAIGQDKDTICKIYGQERFVDITDLKQLPMRLVQIIARHLYKLTGRCRNGLCKSRKTHLTAAY